MYCSGFITTEHIHTDHYVAAGWNSPDQTRFASGSVDYIYIHGRDMQVGDRYEIVRPVRDPDQYDMYPGYRGAVREAGDPYFELGYVKVIDVQKHTAVAVPELACADFVIGDIAIPFVERTPPVFRDVALDRFAPPSGQPRGRIIMANEFDTMLGTSYKAYINLGEKKVKVGDYLRATRTYNYAYHDHVMGMSRYATAYEDTQKDPHLLPAGDTNTLPQQTLGDMIVLQVHKHSATVMIMTALQDIYVGDGVELMDVSAAPELQPLKSGPTAKAVSNPAGTTAPLTMEPDNSNALPPQISCTALPANVRVGESSVITCQATSRDNRPVSITFVTNGGRLSTNRNQATLDTTDSGPGLVEVRATAYDDRQLSASATTKVGVDAPVTTTPTAQKMTQLDFKANSAYVDNRAKAILDDVALKLQHDASSTAVLFGGTGDLEPTRLAAQRAENAKTYLTNNKGIDPQRIQAKPGAQPVGRIVNIWAVPAGATPPAEDKQ
jgi:hypothetical protein